MGEVFRTHDRLTGQVVALKRVRLPLHIGPVAIALDKETSLGLDPTTAPEAPQPPWRPVEARASTAFVGAAGSAPQTVGHGPTRGPHPPKLAATFQAPISAEDRTQACPATPNISVPDPSPELQELRVHLTQEFRTLAGLRHPHIVSVLDYGFDRDHQPYFTMELLEDAVPLDKAARDQPLSVQVSLLLQILQALTYLHRRGVLHRDLKPGNILVVPGPHGPRVKLLDFGLALLTQDLRARNAEIAGTLGYMAPEVLAGASPSEASDLFAVGVMAHEMFVGTHPLGSHLTAALVREFLGPAPIFTADDRLPTALSAVLRRALCRAPSERYADAAVFGQELARAVGLPIPVETIEIRESFLQSATFIARDEELATLRRALANVAAGHGAVWLVGGESGVGKSRLLDELRTLVLVRGIHLVRGQAVSAGGGAYQVWRGALRPLCMDAVLDELDAGVLQTVVPDIARLQDRPISEPPALDPESAQIRLLATIEKLLLTQREPLVVLLEDLHWADPGSLAVVSRLLRSVAHHPLLIVGSYRNDERPDLADEIPGAHVLNLSRLRASEIEKLSTSMLGEVGKRKDVVALLERETAGNAFFIVEVVRALAEEAGNLGKIGTESIPMRVAAGGVSAVLSRRLGRVPEAARPLLYASAVLGRELDLRTLRTLAETQGEDVEAQLQACSLVLVLEVSEGKWRFAHDKLRETLLDGMAKEERAHWHLRIGEAMERAHAENLEQYAAALAYHFDAAGEQARALPHRLVAGERAMRTGAVHEAIEHLERVVALADTVVLAPHLHAHSMALLSRAYHGAGRPHECMQLLQRMFGMMGISLPTSSLKLLLDTTYLLGRHVGFQLGILSHRSVDDSQEAAWLTEAIDATVSTIEASVLALTPGRLLHFYLAFMHKAEQLGDPIRLAYGYVFLGFFFSATPLRWLADMYLQRARQLLAQTATTPLEAWVLLNNVEAVRHLANGEMEQAHRCFGEGLDLIRRTGRWNQELMFLLHQSIVEQWQGHSGIQEGSVAARDELARKVNSAQVAVWGRGIESVNALRNGDLERAAQLLQEGGEQRKRAGDRAGDVLLGGLSALCELRRGDPLKARRIADETLDLIGSAVSPAYGQLDGIAALVEVCIALWAAAPAGREKNDRKLRVEQSLQVLWTFSVMLPVGRPQAWLWSSRYASLRGHPRLASWLLRKAQRAASASGRPFDEEQVKQALDS